MFFDRSMLSEALSGARSACPAAELVSVAADPDRASESRQHADQDPDRRRLSRAVRAQVAEDAARRNLEVDAFQHFVRAEAHPEPLQADDRRGVRLHFYHLVSSQGSPLALMQEVVRARVVPERFCLTRAPKNLFRKSPISCPPDPTKIPARVFSVPLRATVGGSSSPSRSASGSHGRLPRRGHRAGRR